MTTALSPGAALSPAERHRVQQLAALLRLADGLDRSHQAHITGVSVEILPETLILRLHSEHPCRREVASAKDQTLALSPGEQLAFWQALQAPAKLTPSQRQLAKLLRERP